MPGVAETTQDTLDISSIVGSDRRLDLDDSAPSCAAFPKCYQLIITTTKGVFVWDWTGVREIFRSGSEGIVGAKKLSYGRDVLAVADSQVVVLHDVDKGMQRSYRLKGSEVRSLRGPKLFKF